MARRDSRNRARTSQGAFRDVCVCCAKLRGVPALGPRAARLAVESLVLLPPDDRQQILNCKANSCARSHFQIILQRATKLRASIGVCACGGLGMAAARCAGPRGRLRGAICRVRSARAASHRWQAQEQAFHISAKTPRHAHAVAARTRPTQTTQIIASSASRCRAFANRVALRRQK